MQAMQTSSRAAQVCSSTSSLSTLRVSARGHLAVPRTLLGISPRLPPPTQSRSAQVCRAAPIVGLYAGALGGVYLLQTLSVIAARRDSGIFIGISNEDGDDATLAWRVRVRGLDTSVKMLVFAVNRAACRCLARCPLIR